MKEVHFNNFAEEEETLVLLQILRLKLREVEVSSVV